MQVLQIATFVLGCCTTLLSGGLCLYFCRSKQAIGRSVSFMLAGETISGFVIVLFSGTSLFNSLSGQEASLWNSITPEAAIFLRWVMFMAMGISSLHLTFAVRGILKENEHHGDGN